MITRRTKVQLLVFVIITLLGVTFVGAKYARLDKLFYDTSYKVTTQLKESGGIFTGAEVTYRGLEVGQVSNMKLTKNGVDVILDIEKSEGKIPASTLAVVGNKSAVGEQYVELQPKTDSSPYLRDGSIIKSSDTETPISTTELLTNLDQLVESVPQGDLRTVVNELGAAFKGAGTSLGQIIDTSNSFIETANQNFDTTRALIRDSNTVLQTQVDKGSAIRSFSRDLSLFSGTLAGSDTDLRRLIDNGSATANQLRTFIEQNRVPLGQLINNLVTTGQVVVQHLDSIRQLLVLYPYVVSGGYTVAAKTAQGYQAHFGLILQQDSPVCQRGYNAPVRTPTQRADIPMDETARCTEAASQSDARGSQNTRPRAATGFDGSSVTDSSSPLATYDPSTGKTTWSDQAGSDTVAGGGAAGVFGKDSGQWMLLQTAAGSSE